jgi:arabinofuranosyltransferase
MKILLKSAIALLLLAAAGLFTFHLFTLWNFTVDDAFISFRYAEHLAHHGKIVWNVGQQPVEGYTSFLDILLLAIGFLLHVPILVWAKLIGIFSILGIGTIFLRAASQAKNIEFSLTLTLLYAFLLTDIITAIHVVAGLETSIYLFLLFSMALLFSSINTPECTTPLFSQHTKLFSLCCLLIGLTRPEANLYNIIFIIASLLHLKEKKLRLFIKYCALLYIFPGVIYFIWRIYYYHMLFPLPFYIKFEHGGAYPGLPQTIQFLSYYSPLLCNMILTWMFAFKKQKHLVISYAIVFLSGVWFSIRAIPMMDYSFRFSWPMISLMLASGYLTKGLTKNIQKFLLLTLSIAIFLCAYLSYPLELQQEKMTIAYALGLEKAHTPLGKSLAMIKDNSLLVTYDAGAIPFYSHWLIIDGCGLNDKVIASQKLSSAQNIDYIFKQKPRVIIFLSSSATTMLPLLTPEKPLYDEALKKHMKLLKLYQFNPSYYLWVMGYSNDKRLFLALR